MIVVKMVNPWTVAKSPVCGGCSKERYSRAQTELPLRGDAMRLPQRRLRWSWWQEGTPLTGHIHEAEDSQGRRALPDGNDSGTQGLSSLSLLQTMGLTPKEARTQQGLMWLWRAAGRAFQVTSLLSFPLSVLEHRELQVGVRQHRLCS